jgi:twinkle protein
MPTLAERLLEHGIRPRHCRDSGQKLTCPRCSALRRNKADPCLSLTIDGTGAVWNCHHCGWSGGIREGEGETRPPRRRAAPVRPAHAPGPLTPAALTWLAQRGISKTTARRNRLGVARAYIPKLGAEVDCLAFPYFRDGALVNVKFRALAAKAFAQVKGAETLLYGIDDIADAKTVIIVEGECDKLACEEAGYRNVASVPNGAQTGGSAADDSAAFDWTGNCAEHIDRAERIILAVDADDKGRQLEGELARRLGRERCWRVRWPRGDGASCKDANETLLRHGADGIVACGRCPAAIPRHLFRIFSVRHHFPAEIGLQVLDNVGVPNRIRTGVAAVKGRCPRPLDDGDRQTVALSITPSRSGNQSAASDPSGTGGSRGGAGAARSRRRSGQAKLSSCPSGSLMWK